MGRVTKHFTNAGDAWTEKHLRDKWNRKFQGQQRTHHSVRVDKKGPRHWTTTEDY